MKRPQPYFFFSSVNSDVHLKPKGIAKASGCGLRSGRLVRSHLSLILASFPARTSIDRNLVERVRARESLTFVLLVMLSRSQCVGIRCNEGGRGGKVEDKVRGRISAFAFASTPPLTEQNLEELGAAPFPNSRARLL